MTEVVPQNQTGNESAPADSKYEVQLPVFEGPLDLLLHLIRKHEIDIFDIPIALITEKYLAYVALMKILNIEVASDFLVMAATLAQIKSKMLLPPDEGVGEEDEAEEEDPREELVRRLLEYQRYKEAALELKDRPILYRDVFDRQARLPSIQADSPFAEVSIYKLIAALDRVLSKNKKKFSHKVLVERISVADRIHAVVALLSSKPEITFEELFSDSRTNNLIVATFLALLEMARLSLVRLHQTEDSETIYVRSLLEGRSIDSVMTKVQIYD